jgi:hypothetical protein
LADYRGWNSVSQAVELVKISILQPYFRVNISKKV